MDCLLRGLDLPTVLDSQNEVLKAQVTTDELNRATPGSKQTKVQDKMDTTPNGTRYLGSL